MKLVRLQLLKHIENFSHKRVNNMKEKMVKNGIWESPICIEENYRLILDGQHRYNVAIKLGFKYDSSINPNSFFNKTDFNTSTISSEPYYIKIS